MDVDDDGGSGGSVAAEVVEAGGGGGAASEPEKKSILEAEPKVKRKMKTAAQLEILEKAYAVETYPSEALRAELAVKLGLSDRQLQMWFCHRRLKDRKGPAEKRMKKEASPGMANGLSSGIGGEPNVGHGGTAMARIGPELPTVKRFYEPPQALSELRAIALVEAQLGERLREDGPVLGLEFDPLPPGAFGSPLVASGPQKPSVRLYETHVFESPGTKVIQGGKRTIHEYQFLPEQPSLRDDIRERDVQIHLYGSPVDAQNSVTALPAMRSSVHGSEQLHPAFGFQDKLSSLNLAPQLGNQGHQRYPPLRQIGNVPPKNTFGDIDMDAHVSQPLMGPETSFFPSNRRGIYDEEQPMGRKRKVHGAGKSIHSLFSLGEGSGPRHTKSRCVDASARRRRDEERTRLRAGEGQHSVLPAGQQREVESSSDNEDSHSYTEREAETESESMSVAPPLQPRRHGRFVSVGSTGSSKRSRASGDETWIVTGRVRGGPATGDVIPSFLGHVASRMWPNPHVRPLLRCQNRLTVCAKLRDWYNRMPSDGQETLQATGLSHLCSTMFDHIDTPLICAFVERWQPDTNTFHMPFGEMTIMLHDVWHILRVPVDGQMISACPDVGQVQALCWDILACSRETLLTEHWLHGSICYQTVLDEGRAGRNVKDQTILWTWLLLGSTLFVDKSGNRFRPDCLVELIHGVDGAQNMSWGSACLAFLYRQLGIASRGDCAGIGGCLTLLQAWIYEYFPCFRPHRQPQVVEASAPSARRWSVTVTERSEERLHYIRIRLDQMTAQEVMWLPFGTDPASVVERTTYNGWIRLRDIIEPYMPARVLRQLGYVQRIPPPMYRPLSAYRGWTSKSYNVMHPESTAVDAWEGFPYSSQLSLSRYQRSGDDPCACEEKYLDWFRLHSHPFLLGGYEPHEPVRPPRANSDYWVNAFIRSHQLTVRQLKAVDPAAGEEAATRLFTLMEQWNLAP